MEGRRPSRNSGSMRKSYKRPKAAPGLDVAPAFQRREQHEYVGRAIALILVIDPPGPSRFGRDGHAGFGDQLLRGLIQADDGAFGIARPVIDVQHVFHVGDESGAGLRRNDILLLQMRLSR
jgi:hypothetical protein